MFSERRITRRIFQKNLVKSSKKQPIQINVTIRRTLGSDIDAACGTLRKRVLESRKPL